MAPPVAGAIERTDSHAKLAGLMNVPALPPEKFSTVCLAELLLLAGVQEKAAIELCACLSVCLSLFCLDKSVQNCLFISHPLSYLASFNCSTDLVSTEHKCIFLFSATLSSGQTIRSRA